MFVLHVQCCNGLAIKVKKNRFLLSAFDRLFFFGLKRSRVKYITRLSLISCANAYFRYYMFPYKRNKWSLGTIKIGFYDLIREISHFLM